jgi:hypothetical protein
MYLPDNTGVYTDTAEFIEVIPECTNISVGYYSEHSDKEKLDIIHFQALADRVALIDWDSLPTDRDPTVVETMDWGQWGAYYPRLRRVSVLPLRGTTSVMTTGTMTRTPSRFKRLCTMRRLAPSSGSSS